MSSALTLSGHIVPTSIASIMQRTHRHNVWSRRHVLGNIPAPVYVAADSAVDVDTELKNDYNTIEDPVVLLETNDEGIIDILSYDLKSVGGSVIYPGERVVTFVSRSTPGHANEKETVVYLTVGDDDGDPNSASIQNPIYVILKNDEARFPNALTKYQINAGEVRYIIVRDGRIVAFEN